MRIRVFSIYDTAAACYLRPFFMQTDAQAMRAFSEIAVSSEHEVGKHPEDYTLFVVGTWDDNKGELQDIHNEALITGLEAVAAARNVDKAQLRLLDDAIKVGGSE